MKSLQQPLLKGLTTCLMIVGFLSLSACIVAEPGYGHRGGHDRHEDSRDDDGHHRGHDERHRDDDRRYER